jgi:hypothetical protein
MFPDAIRENDDPAIALFEAILRERTEASGRVLRNVESPRKTPV